MTREEKALEASKKIGNSLYDNNAVPLTRETIGFAFQSGIKWADAHPKSPWISVENDLPCFHKELFDGTETKHVVTLDSNGDIHLDYMIYYFTKWEWNRKDANILFWFPIQEPPKTNE